MKLVLRDDESGVSEVVGTILILAMTVVLFASIILWVGSIPTPTTQTRVDLKPTMTPVYAAGVEIAVNITLLHRGVESLNPALTFIYVTSVRGSNPPSIDREILHKYNPLLGTPSGLLDGSDAVWNIGERWAYLNFTLRSTDQITVTIIDASKNIVVWTAPITAPSGTRPPVFVAKWADDLSGTASIDPIQASLGFILYARVIDPDNDLNRNSIYATVTAWFGANSTCANPQKMHDDGIYPDIAANDDVFSLGANGCQDPPNPSLSWDGSLILMNATDLGSHRTETRLRMTVIPRTSGGGGSGTGSWAILSVDQPTSASAPLQTATNMAFALLPNSTYTFKFWVIFRSASSSNGIRIGLTFPSVFRFSAAVEIPVTADGTGGTHHGFLTFSGDAVISTAVQAANTDYVAIVEGIIRVSIAGNLQLVFASESSGTTVTIREGTSGQLQIAA